MSLGTLTVDLVANIARFESDMGRASKAADKRAKEIAKSIDDVARLSVTAFAVAGVAVAAGLKKAIDEADNLSKAAQKVGVDVENLSKLKFAGNLSDVDFDSLTSALGKLNKASVAAAGGSKEQSAAFERLGISVVDQNGKLKSTNDILYEVADAYARTADDAAKSANSVAIFGKAGADLIPLLNGGSIGLRKMGNEAVQLGLNVREDAGKAAEEFNDNLTRLQGAVAGASNQLAQQLTPTLVVATGALVDAAKALKDNDGFQDFVEDVVVGTVVVSESLVGIAKLARAVAGSFEVVGAELRVVDRFLSTDNAFADGREELSKALDERNRILKESNARYVELWEYNGTAASDAIRKSYQKQKAAKLGVDLYEPLPGFFTRTSVMFPPKVEQPVNFPLKPGFEYSKPTIGYKPTTLDFKNAEAARRAMIAAEADYAKQLLATEEAANEIIKEQLAQQKQRDEIQRIAQRTFDLQGLNPDDQSRLGGIMDAEDQYNDQLDAIKAFYDGKIGFEKEANAASEAALIAYNERVAALNRQRGETDVKLDAETKALLQLQSINFAQSAIGLLQQFGGQSKKQRLALLAFEKAAAIAEIIINTQLAAAKVQGQLGVFGLPLSGIIIAQGVASAALVAATGIKEAGDIKGGRANGGIVDAGKLYEVGEGNRPELLRSGSKSYLIPGNNGGTVIPSRAANDSGPMRIEVVNIEGQTSRTTTRRGTDGRELIQVVIQEVQADIARGGQIAGQIERTYGSSRVSGAR